MGWIPPSPAPSTTTACVSSCCAAAVNTSVPDTTWVSYQRTLHFDGALDTQLEHRLEELPGWTWDPRADQWENGFSKMLRYVERHGDARVAQSNKDDEGYRLGGWVGEQRASYAKGAIDAERQRRLQELPGWTWNATGKRGTQQ
jgi:hypothetical protein